MKFFPSYFFRHPASDWKFRLFSSSFSGILDLSEFSFLFHSIIEFLWTFSQKEEDRHFLLCQAIRYVPSRLMLAVRRASSSLLSFVGGNNNNNRKKSSYSYYHNDHWDYWSYKSMYLDIYTYVRTYAFLLIRDGNQPTKITEPKHLKCRREKNLAQK